MASREGRPDHFRGEPSPPGEVKARRPEIPWQKVAGIGNVLRHNYESIAAPIIWKLAQDDLPALKRVCREELKAEKQRRL